MIPESQMHSFACAIALALGNDWTKEIAEEESHDLRVREYPDTPKLLHRDGYGLVVFMEKYEWPRDSERQIEKVRIIGRWPHDARGNRQGPYKPRGMPGHLLFGLSWRGGNRARHYAPAVADIPAELP